ncbi:MAG: hypothetical protein OQK35_06995 [Alphaproteobacteria bacterium]|nr:hypothetical protein [Rhodospirillales bacterium]MCW9046065.1 hypothetical protein [Alphaproteobacteria bacterium]
MTMTVGVITYLILWWMVFMVFVLLGRRNIAEGRPNPSLLLRFAFISLVAGAMWAVIEAFMVLNIIEIKGG